MSKKLPFLLIILLLAGGLFWYASKKTVAPVISTPTPVVTPEPTVTPTPDVYSQHIEAIPGNTDEVWYNIPELGVRMRIEKSFAEDLIYTYTKSSGLELSAKEKKHVFPFHEIAYFSTKSLQKIEPACDPGGGALGRLVKEDGDINEWGDSSVFWRQQPSVLYMTKQFPKSFIVLEISEDTRQTPACYFVSNSKWAQDHKSSDTRRAEDLTQQQQEILLRVSKSVEQMP